MREEIQKLKVLSIKDFLSIYEKTLSFCLKCRNDIKVKPQKLQRQK